MVGLDPDSLMDVAMVDRLFKTDGRCTEVWEKTEPSHGKTKKVNNLPRKGKKGGGAGVRRHLGRRHQFFQPGEGSEGRGSDDPVIRGFFSIRSVVASAVQFNMRVILALIEQIMIFLAVAIHIIKLNPAIILNEAKQAKAVAFAEADISRSNAVGSFVGGGLGMAVMAATSLRPVFASSSANELDDARAMRDKIANGKQITPESLQAETEMTEEGRTSGVTGDNERSVEGESRGETESEEETHQERIRRLKEDWFKPDKEGNTLYSKRMEAKKPGVRFLKPKEKVNLTDEEKEDLDEVIESLSPEERKEILPRVESTVSKLDSKVRGEQESQMKFNTIMNTAGPFSTTIGQSIGGYMTIGKQQSKGQAEAAASISRQASATQQNLDKSAQQMLEIMFQMAQKASDASGRMSGS